MPVLRPRPPVQPTVAGPSNGQPPGLAPQIAAPGSRGQDARFDVTGLPQVRPGVYRDAAGYEYDSNGLALGNRPLYNAGLPRADEDYMAYYAGGGGGSGAGGVFSNPYYQQVLAAVNAGGAADAASRRAGIQQLLIAFGLVPEGFNDKYGDVDPLTRELAAKNTTSGISTRARLLDSLQQGNRMGLRALASTGNRRSGSRGYKLRRNQLEFDQRYADALGQVQGQAGTLYSQFAQNEYQRALQLAAAAQFAAQMLPDSGGQGPQIAPTNPYLLQPNDSGYYDVKSMFMPGNTTRQAATRSAALGTGYTQRAAYVPPRTNPYIGTARGAGGGVLRTM